MIVVYLTWDGEISGIGGSEGLPILHHRKKSVKGNKNKLWNKLLVVQSGNIVWDVEFVHSVADTGRCRQMTRTEVYIKHDSAAHSALSNGALCVVAAL